MRTPKNPAKPRRTSRNPPKPPCTCHDPTVFGHITCRHETQPDNNTTPLPGLNATRIDNTCILQLQQALRETTRHMQELTTMIQYIEQRPDRPPPHG